MDDLSKTPVIRTMTRKDFDRIAEIDQKVLGQSRPEYWEMRAALVERKPFAASLVAEIDGRVVGFVIGDAKGWEYGVPQQGGWIDTIGVDPDYQKMGIGMMLFREMIDHFKEVGVETIYTFVNWREWRLLKFFEAVGFNAGDMINLKLDI